jgi:small subunit ribosomal protein S17e
VRRFPDKFTDNFEENKRLVGLLLQGPSRKVRNQIAGYIARSLRGQEEEVVEEETSAEEGETE